MSFQELVEAFCNKRKEAGPAAEIRIGYRVWDALTSTPEAKHVNFNPWDSGRNVTTHDGVPISIREDFDGNRIEVVSCAMREAEHQVETLVLTTMRETQEKPVEIEIGTELWKLYCGARSRSQPFHNGIPIRVIEDQGPNFLRARPNLLPPVWCQIGVCMEKGPGGPWGIVISIHNGLVVLDEIDEEENVSIHVFEVRGSWAKIPPRVRIRTRYARVRD